MHFNPTNNQNWISIYLPNNATVKIQNYNHLTYKIAFLGLFIAILDDKRRLK